VKYLTDAERRKEYEAISSYLKEIAEFARGLKVGLAVEPLCRYDAYLLNTVAQARELVDLIDEENVGILFDTFHANIEEKSMSAAIETAGDKLFYIQACENDRGTPGSGQVRWKEFARGLDKIGYDGWITVESFTPSEKEFASRMRVWRKLAASQDSIAVDGLAFLKRLLGSRV
jgi:D-psicose/D-tagatose/L-ribulose 3-epimerase